MSNARVGDLLYPDDRDDNGGGEFEDFLPDDAGEADIEYLGKVRDVIGRPISELFSTVEALQQVGQVGDLRGVRFGSGYEALRWLFQRGLFLYSKLVKMSDGSWGVAIGTSQTQETPDDVEEGNDDDLIF